MYYTVLCILLGEVVSSSKMASQTSQLFCNQRKLEYQNNVKVKFVLKCIDNNNKSKKYEKSSFLVVFSDCLLPWSQVFLHFVISLFSNTYSNQLNACRGVKRPRYKQSVNNKPPELTKLCYNAWRKKYSFFNIACFEGHFGTRNN